MTFSRDKGQEEQIGAIQSYLFGGLNTTANNLNCPYEDSPLLLNADVGIEGSVYKRKGSRVVFGEHGTSTGVGLIPFTSALNYNLLLAKRGTSLEVFELLNDQAYRVMTKANVFSSAVDGIAPSYVRTSEVEPRLLLFTGYNKPVQVTFVEQQATLGGTTSTLTLTKASRYKNATTSNLLVFANRVRVPVTGVSYDATTQTLTVTSSSTYQAGVLLDFMLITWQWWAEAMLWNGDRYFKTVTRNNAVAVDQVVPIPASLRSDIDPLQGASVSYNIFPYRWSDLVTGSSYIASASRQPQTYEEYGWSDGARYVYNVNNKLTPSPFFITFGALEGSTPTAVYLLRRRELRLNAGKPLANASIHCYVNGVKRVQRTANAGSAYMDYWLHQRLGDSTTGYYSQPITNNATQPEAYYLSFEATTLGVPGSATVEVINATVSHIGSAATANRYDYNDGSYYPVYGIGLYADYNQGFYPSTCAITQGRLVLAGYPHQPLLLTVSATYDAYDPGRPFTFFQVTDDLLGIDTDPFDAQLSSRPDDRIITVLEWQSSLFCLTRKGVYRLHGGNQPLTIRNRFINFISNQGCINAKCITRTEDSILYLADTGVYDLVPQIENAEYQTREKSIKIRNVFGLTSDPTYEDLPWMEYDSLNKMVYVGYPMKDVTAHCKRLYVYNTLRQSWTEYDTMSGFNSYVGVEAVDRALGNRFILACTAYGTDFQLLKMQDDMYLDYIRKTAALGVAENIMLPRVPQYVYTTQPYQKLYSVNRHKVSSGSFPVLPVQDVEDIVVTYQGRRLAFGVDYVKTPTLDILLTFTPVSGGSLVVTPRRPITDSEAGQINYDVTAPTDPPYYVWLEDHVPSAPHYLSSVSGYQYGTTNLTAGVVVETGQPYLSIYTTPLMNASLMQMQRMLHLYAYFDNSAGQDVYVPGDVNTGVGQPHAAIVDMSKVRLNANITVIYSSESTGQTSADIYGFKEIVWDDAFFDIDPPNKSFLGNQMFKEPIKGVGYSIQLMVWNFDEATFRLAGYQLDANLKGKRYKSRY